MPINGVTVSGMGLRDPFTANGLPNDTTVESVLEFSGADYDNLVIAVNGQTVSDLSRPVRTGDIITGAASTKGA